MNRIYTTAIILLSAITVIAQNGEITNGGFESWEDLTMYESPDTWSTSDQIMYYGAPTTSKSTDAADGTYSARIDAVEIEGSLVAGYFYHGTMDQTGPIGGIAYSDNFEAISLQYKTDLNPGDSLYLLMIRYNAGTLVELTITPFAYGTNSAWTPTVIYVGNAIQDELFIGFLMGDPNGGNDPSAGSYAMIDDVTLLSGGVETTDLPNHSFEDWTTTTYESPQSWFTLNGLLAGYGLENANKTTDAYSGSYALEMTTIDAFTDTIASILSFGAIDFSNPTPFESIPYTQSPATFVCRYKYAPANGDIAEIYVEFYEAGVPIGVVYEQLSPASNYMSLVSTVTLAGTPDSVLFYAHSGANPGSVLILDDVNFMGGNVGLEEIIGTDFELYPNPANDHVVIGLPSESSFDIDIVNMEGRSVRRISSVNGVHTVDIQDLDQGVYIVKIFDGTSSTTQKLVVN
ncbi:MAG: T9SS type A sorting domain-containing protein [Crocinitomicaceae bacterium]|nr:T9SS type A sorting domain-containing protein [Crocinitomicaceae bacterium]